MTSVANYAALRDARRTLEQTADDLFEAVRDATPVEARDLTRVAVLCEIADDAIFAALNAASAYLDDADAAASLFPERAT